MHMPVLDTSEVVVRIIDDNLVLAHETLGQSWDRACETWASNDNRRPRPPAQARSRRS